MSRPKLLILGASARAAAFSALRAGFRPIAADLFGDVDIIEACEWYQTVPNYPTDLPQIAKQAPPARWLYTGALENHPGLVEQIRSERELIGNGEPALSAVRDPHGLATAFRGAGLLFPDIAESAGPTPDSRPTGEWLRKPFASSGGNGITRVPASTPNAVEPAGLSQMIRSSGSHAGQQLSVSTVGESSRNKRYFFQRYVPGVPCSATYVVANGRAVLLGVTRQLIGTSWTGAREFQYSGSIGPVAISEPQLDDYQRIGNLLAGRFSLSGLIGVDTVVDAGRVWTVEVNPRYTAAVEVLERSLNISAISLHVAASQGRLTTTAAPVKTGTCWGKAILYARRDLEVANGFITEAQRVNSNTEEAVIADIPRAGSQIRQGTPVCTVFASAIDVARVERALRSAANVWLSRLFGNGG